MSNRVKTKATKAGATKPPCPCCEGRGVLPTSSSGLADLVDGDVALLCCDGCLDSLILSGRPHPHELIRAEPHYHWPAVGDYVKPCSDAESYVTQTAVVSDHHNDETMAEGRQATRDHLIEGLGELRVSGVWWSHHHGAEALEVLADALPLTSDEPRVAEVRAKSAEYLNASEDAVLVVAWCLARVPDGTTAYDHTDGTDGGGS